MKASLLEQIDNALADKEFRSIFFARAARHLIRKRRDEREIEIINANADALNKEVADMLCFTSVVILEQLEKA